METANFCSERVATMADPVELHVERLGRRGEGVASLEGRAVYVPYGLPGEAVMAVVAGERARVTELVTPRPDRLDPICPYFGTCGGCAVQTLAPGPYGAWKRNLVATGLERAGVVAEVGDVVDAYGEGRRRATFHAQFGPGGAAPRVGFMEAGAHSIVPIEFCPILAPEIADAVGAARLLASVSRESGKPLDILVTGSDCGLDVDLRGLGSAAEKQVLKLVDAADRLALARLSNHGHVLTEARVPTVRIADVELVLPPGAFLQATRRGEEVLGERVLAAVGDARRVADLFCGVGTFSLRLAVRARVEAWDNDARATAALSNAARSASRLRPLNVHCRDLFQRPVRAEELVNLDALVFDPPRAGAAAQAAQIARSEVATVVAVSCDPGSFARDASTLVQGGYRLEAVTPIDQFRYSAHVEIVGVFRKARRASKKRRLLT